MYNNPFGVPYGNPFAYSSMTPSVLPKVSLFSKLRGGINWSNFLSGTSKTLNVINQAIPLYYQVKPLVKNASTLFKIADIIKSDDGNGESRNTKVNARGETREEIQTKRTEKRKEEVRSSSNPAFFI